MRVKMNRKEAMIELEKGFPEAESVLNDKSKVDRMLEDLEKKLRTLPKVGEALSHVPVFIQLVKCYIKKEYTSIPIASVIAIMSALLYFILPFDAIPDFIPFIGHLDDGAVIVACLHLVDHDVKDFIEWRNRYRNNNSMVLE
ncbi:MAG: YkvA family protein [Candidatus Izemoplasmatales bacterium]|nr:YkvA family protein [Candidatus Izemoplasmatales bacterium]